MRADPLTPIRVASSVLLLALIAVAGCGHGAPNTSSEPPAIPPSRAAASTTATTTPTPSAPAITKGAASGAIVEPPLGHLVAGSVVPGQLSIGWDQTGGNLVNCDSYTRNDEVEGDKTLSRCRMAVIDASAAPSAWAESMPSDAQLAPFVARQNVTAGRSVASYVRAQADFNQYAVALRGPRRFFYTTERDYTGAVGGCATSVSFFANDAQSKSVLMGCAVWQPALAAAQRGDTLAILARGIDDKIFAAAYQRFQASGGAYPWATSMRDRLVLVTGDGPPTTAVWTGGRGTPVIAVGQSVLAIGSLHMEPTRAAPAQKLIEVLLHGLPPKDGAPMHAVVLARGNVGMPAIAAVANGFVVVWAEKDDDQSGYFLRGAEVSNSGVVTDLGSLTPRTAEGGASALAPGLAAESGSLALTYTEERPHEPSAIRFACGVPDLKKLAAATAVVGDRSKRSRDSEVMLAPDGTAGVLAWHEFTKTSQGIRVAKFSCPNE